MVSRESRRLSSSLKAVGIAGTWTAGMVRAGTGADIITDVVLAGVDLRDGKDGGMKNVNVNENTAAIEQ
jgi:hypothetical protein